MDTKILRAKANKTPLEIEAQRLIELAAIREGLTLSQQRWRELSRRITANNKAGRHPLSLEAAHETAVDFGYRHGTPKYYRAVGRLAGIKFSQIRNHMREFELNMRKQIETAEAEDLLSAFDAIPDLDELALIKDQSDE